MNHFFKDLKTIINENKNNEKMGFPEDAIKLFLKYNGSLNFYIWFLSPMEKNWEECIEEIRKSYLYLKEAFEIDINIVPKYIPQKNEGYPFNFYPQKEGLIPWAQCDNGTIFYWKPSSKQWTIIVYGESWKYYEYNMTTTEFLYKLISKEIPDMYEYLPEDIFEDGVNYYSLNLIEE